VSEGAADVSERIPTPRRMLGIPSLPERNPSKKAKTSQKQSPNGDSQQQQQQEQHAQQPSLAGSSPPYPYQNGSTHPSEANEDDQHSAYSPRYLITKAGQRKTRSETRAVMTTPEHTPRGVNGETPHYTPRGAIHTPRDLHNHGGATPRDHPTARDVAKTPREMNTPRDHVTTPRTKKGHKKEPSNRREDGTPRIVGEGATIVAGSLGFPSRGNGDRIVNGLGEVDEGSLWS